MASPTLRLPMWCPEPRYDNLVVAGLGAVGRAFFRLAGDVVTGFSRLVAVERDEVAAWPLPSRLQVHRFDLTDHPRLGRLLDSLPGSTLLVNLCSGLDNVQLRRFIAHRDVAYLDAACCAPAGSSEVRFSRMMPYSLTPVESRQPQWLCWGINPGMVELVARRLLHRLAIVSGAKVTVYEHDTIHQAHGPEEGVAVGWCVSSLVEEVMESPTFLVRDGRDWEGPDMGAVAAVAHWDGEAVASRVVGHEDIWNLGRLEEVADAAFLYGLHPRVMAVFDEYSPADARRIFSIPAPHEVVHGRERIAVQVRDEERHGALIWEEDHHAIWQRYRMNAVQYQTAKSVLFAVLLMQHSAYGHLPGQYTASTLPVAGEEEWRFLEDLMGRLAINWHKADVGLSWSFS